MCAVVGLFGLLASTTGLVGVGDGLTSNFCAPQLLHDALFHTACTLGLLTFTLLPLLQLVHVMGTCCCSCWHTPDELLNIQGSSPQRLFIAVIVCVCVRVFLSLSAWVCVCTRCGSFGVYRLFDAWVWACVLLCLYVAMCGNLRRLWARPVGMSK
uniref:Transmembrane protein 107 n=1 Tax=Eutreptiella gymnastica TaxID=73025 RepID=A0A7S4FYS3_9EUGL|mmetsp:Transcript_58101/g.96206  ORF Transcript_58101/g.96206 Transcript_58101/m.96206 type:complete len:155 (-) Transcript_58101:197-661(-)